MLCQGDSYRFQTTYNSQCTTWAWTFGDGNMSDAMAPSHAYTPSGAYSVKLIGEGSICTDTAYASLMVDSMLPGAFKAEPDAVCVGESIAFYPLVDSSTTGLQWTFSEAS